MKKPRKEIPVHDFSPEDDLGKRQVRLEVLQARDDYAVSEPHRHLYYELFFFKAGGGTHLVDFTEYIIADNSVHLIGPGQVHLLRRAPGSYGAVIHFRKEVALLLPQVHQLLQATRTPTFDFTEDTYSRIELILSLFEDAIRGRDVQMDEVVACLWQILLKVNASERSRQVKYETRGYKYFSQLRQLVEEHYRENLAPAWYADQLHITEKRLNEVCKEATGTTVSAYLKDRVILEAKRLLSHSGGSVKEISYHLGFEDPSYFARFFKKNTGITAGEFKMSQDWGDKPD